MADSSRRRKGEVQEYLTRTYRDFSVRGDLTAFSVSREETDLYIRAERDLSQPALQAVLYCRKEIEEYILVHPVFRTVLHPLPPDPKAPAIVRHMLAAAEKARVGPMAAVAGAIAEHVGRELARLSKEVIVENGGDIYLNTRKPTTVGIFAGKAALSGRIGVRIPQERTPCGICTSSGTVGPSLSFGRADAVTVWAPDTALADAAATAIGNLISGPGDIEPALEKAGQIPGLLGVVAILGDKVGLWGEMEIVRTSPK